MQRPTTWPRRDGVALVCPDQHVTPATKIDQCTQKARTKNTHAKCFVLNHPVRIPDKICTHAQTCLCMFVPALCSSTLLVGLTKSARMHKRTNETRAGAGHSDVCSLLHAPTHAVASERALLAWCSGMRFWYRSGARGNILNSRSQTH